MIEPISFPPVGYESGLNGTPIYGGSLAINEILNTLRANVQSPSTPTFTVALINAYTLVDSVMSSNRADGVALATIRDAVNHDASILCQYFRAYSTNRGIDPKVVIYLPDYSLLDSHVRTLSPKRAAVLAAYTELKKSVVMTENTVLFGDYGIIKCGSRTIPHLLVPKVLKSHVSFACTCIVSHVPVDLHIRDIVGRSSLYLAERYTGKLVQGTDFSKKIDDAGHVPFFKETHMAFGDKLMIAPIIQGKARTSLLKLAESENWKQRTPTDILKRVSEVLTPDQKTDLIKRINVL